MRTSEFVEEVIDAIYTVDGISSVSTYAESGVLTYDKGVVVKLTNGDEFQITIVKSESGDDDDQVD